MSIRTDASGSASFFLSPNPILTTVMSIGTIDTGGSMYLYTGSPGLYGAVIDSAVRSVFSNFRVVAAGFRARNLLTPLTCTGKFIAAPVVVSGDTPGPELLASLTIASDPSNVINDATGISAGIIDNAILNLPDSKEYSMLELMNTPLELRVRPVTAKAFEFHSTNAVSKSNATSEFTPYQSFTSASGVGSTVADTRAWVDQSGHSGFLVSITGAPALTSVIELEYILHMEGTPPAINAGSLVTGDNAIVHVNTKSFYEAIMELATIENIHKVMDFMGGSRVPRYPALRDEYF